MNSFCDLFDLIDLESIKKTIESPIDYSGVFKLLKKYEDNDSFKGDSKWDAKKAFFENHYAFQKHLKKEPTFINFHKDLALLLKIKLKTITDPAYLVTLDVLDSRNFSLMIENSTLIIKLTPEGESLLFDSGEFIEKAIYQLKK